MIATSLSTQSCPTGLCGQCGPCRREMREADRLMRPKTLPPIELSPTVQQLLAEDRKRTRPTRRPIPKVANRRAATPTAIPTSNQACTQCGELRGYRTIGSKATTHILDGEGTLCQVCADHPRIQATITRLENKPGPRTKSETTLLSKSRFRIQRITKNGRPFHPNANHGSGNGYVSYLCRCAECRDWRAEQDRAARAKKR
nr:hypothetical protein [Rhodococcus qingshengii]